MNQISTHLVADGAEHAVIMLTEANLVTVEQARSISTAVTGLQVMQRVSTGVGERHFAAVDVALSVRASTPAMKAREELAAIGRVWKDFNEDFHKYRELYFQSKVMRAKLAKAKKALDGSNITDEDRDILAAEIELDQARISRVEAEVAQGHAALQGILTTVKGASERYALTCEKNGKPFTEEDFLVDECHYMIKSAFWHASQTFGYVDISVNKYLAPKDRIRKIRLGQDVRMLFQELGIQWHEVSSELKEMMEQTRMLDAINEGRDMEAEKQARFIQWLDRLCKKYQEGALKSLRSGGKDRLDRISQLITPTDQDKGSRPGTDVGRPNIME